MTIVILTRNRKTKQTLVRQSFGRAAFMPGTDAGCQNCGRLNRHERLFRYGVLYSKPEPHRTAWDDYLFCSLRCRTAFAQVVRYAAPVAGEGRTDG